MLQKPSAEDRAAIDAAIDKALGVLPQILAGDMQTAMNRLHTEEPRKAEPAKKAEEPKEAPPAKAAEKPGLIDKDGKLRSLEGVVKDIDSEAISPAGLAKLRGLKVTVRRER